MLPLANSGAELISKPGQDKTILRQFYRNRGTYGTVLLVWAVDSLGWDEETKQPNVCVWHPETVRMELEKQVGISLVDENFDKLMACVAVLTTDAFFKDPGRFIILTNALVGEGFDPHQVDHPSSLEIAWAVTEALLLVPPDAKDPEPFSTEVRHYIGQVLREEGYVTPPDILRIALDADFSAKVTYDFGDDPEMFGAITKMQEDKAKTVTAVIAEGLEALLGQLKALPLQTGTTAELEQRIGQTLRSTTTAED